MSADLVKDHAMSIGSQLASIEANIARCMSMVMQAAMHDLPGVLNSAVKEAELIDDQATALVVELRSMQRRMRS